MAHFTLRFAKEISREGLRERTGMAYSFEIQTPQHIYVFKCESRSVQQAQRTHLNTIMHEYLLVTGICAMKTLTCTTVATVT
jgi:hypothetical protein